MKEVEEGVTKNKQSSGTTVYETSPPPLMIFSGQLEVKQRNGDEGCDNGQHYKRQIQDAEESVYLVAPDSRKDVMQLDVDRREGQEASHHQLSHGMPVPLGDGRDLSFHLVRPTRRTELVGDISTHACTKHSHGEVNEGDDGSD